MENMIINKYISLKPDSPERMEALNIIKYTFLLDYKLPEITDEHNWISLIMEQCDLCCRDFLSTDEHNDPIYLDFFGVVHMPSSLTPRDKKPLINYLYTQGTQQKFSFSSMILQHCLFSSYHAVLTDLFQSDVTTAYCIANSWKDQGIYNLYNRGSLPFSKKRKKINYAQDIKPQKRSSRAASFSESAKRHSKVLTHLNDLFIQENNFSESRSASPTEEDTQSEVIRFYSQFAGQYYKICSINPSYWKSLFVPQRNNENAFITAIQDICDNLFPKILKGNSQDNKDIEANKIANHFQKEPIDHLYHIYITERIFNFNLLYGLLQNIRQIETTTIAKYNLHYDSLIPGLCSCKMLPNVFSRQYFVQYAFENILYESSSFLDYWHDRDRRYDNAIGYNVDDFSRGFNLPRWHNQYNVFNELMGSYLIPIYEWCFINMLMETIEEKYREEDHSQHLIHAMELLTSYINKNHLEILRPIRLKKGMDWVDLISKQNWTNFEGYFSDNEDFIKKMFIHISDIDDASKQIRSINLSHLNRDSIMMKSINQNISNRSLVRDTYIKFIRKKYFH